MSWHYKHNYYVNIFMLFVYGNKISPTIQNIFSGLWYVCMNCHEMSCFTGYMVALVFVYTKMNIALALLIHFWYPHLFSASLDINFIIVL